MCVFFVFVLGRSFFLNGNNKVLAVREMGGFGRKTSGSSLGRVGDCAAVVLGRPMDQSGGM